MIVKVYNRETAEYSYLLLEEFEYAFNYDCMSSLTHEIEFIYNNEEK